MSLLETRTISLHIKQAQLQNDIVEILRSATHLKNMMIILLKRAYQTDEKLYSFLLNPDVVRAILYDRSGGKKAPLVKKCKSLISSMSKQDQDFYEQIRDRAQQFDAKHIYKLVKALVGEFKGFYTKIKKGERARPPRAQKLRTLSHAAISIDKERVSIKERGLSIRVGKDQKLDIPMNLKAIDKLISLEKVISYRLCYDGRHVSINISYRKQVEAGRVLSHEKYAGIDLGVNNLSSILVYDEHTPSLVISGIDFKAYNCAFNKKKAKLASKRDLISNRLSEIEAEVYEAIDDYDGGEIDQELCEELAEWHHLRPQYESCKRTIDHLYSNRKNFFQTNFHKTARNILRYLEKHEVSHLILSRNILEAKNRSNMGRKANQKFVYIPYAILLDALKLYGIEHGIEVIDDVDEAYSSKCNAIFGDVVEAGERRGQDKTDTEVKKARATAFQGRRHKGAFYCRQSGKIWHSDLNGALNHIWIYLGLQDSAKKSSLASFKLESPLVLKGRKLFEWLDRPLAA